MSDQSLLEHAIASAFKAKLRDASMAVDQPCKLRVALVTALKKERFAVENMFEHRIPTGTGRRGVLRFSIGVCDRKYGSYNILVTDTVNMGLSSAAIAATAIGYEYPSVELLIMVGIAGGVPDPVKDTRRSDKHRDHVRLGDVVAAKEPIVQYDLLKTEVSRNLNRYREIPPARAFLDALAVVEEQEMRGEYQWELYLDKFLCSAPSVARPAGRTDRIQSYTVENGKTIISGGYWRHPRGQPRRRVNRPLVHYSKIGSANTLLKDPALRDKVKAEHGVVAIEMEGSGIADSTFSMKMGYGVVRGICDYCDMNKKDTWQAYASVVAAAFTKYLLDVIHDEKILDI